MKGRHEKKKQASEEYTGPRCPKCRAPVPAGASRCTRCNTLLDPDTGQVRDKLTEADMVELVDASRRARTKGIVKTVIGILIMLLAVLLAEDKEGGLLYSAGVIVAVIGGGVAPAEAETGGQSVTRETLAALLWLRVGSPVAGADLSTFSDADSISGENRTAMAWAVSQGLLAGYGNGTLGPDGILTRAQAATVVMRLHQAVLSEGGLALPNASQPTPVQWERQFTVVIDPGHGGRQPGAYYSGASEKEINLSVALKLENLLTARGYQVVMTRSDDTGIGLYERAELANASGADLFVSLHSNAMVNAPNFQGILTYHYPSDSSGAELAQSIQTAVCQATGGADRGVRSADFVVLRETDMSAALVEMGYMSSPGELERLLDTSYQDKLVQGIAEGIAQYLGAPE